jgi:hypothetical protein
MPMTIDPNDVTPDPEPRHREAMLELVLAWGSLDGALGMLLSCARGLPFHEGAEQFGLMPASAKLAEIYRVLRDATGDSIAAKKLKKYKKDYERLSVIRNRIAHAHCVGIWNRDREYAVFTVFEKFGDNQLVVEGIPIEQMTFAAAWARELRTLVLKIVDVYSPLESS